MPHFQQGRVHMEETERVQLRLCGFGGVQREGARTAADGWARTAAYIEVVVA